MSIELFLQSFFSARTQIQSEPNEPGTLLTAVDHEEQRQTGVLRTGASDSKDHVRRINSLIRSFGNIHWQNGYTTQDDFELVTVFSALETEMKALQRNLNAILDFAPLLTILPPGGESAPYSPELLSETTFTISGKLTSVPGVLAEVTEVVSAHDGLIRIWQAKQDNAAFTGTEMIDLKAIVEFPREFDSLLCLEQLDKLAERHAGYLELLSGVAI